MSENRIKRRRKDKLVPRDYNLEGDKGVSPQEELYMKLINMKNESDNDDTMLPPPSPHLEFSVNVEVEEYNEYDLKQDDIITNMAISESDNIIQKVTHNTSDPPNLTPTERNVTRKTSKHDNYTEFVIDINNIQTETETTNLADKLLYIDMKNMIGSVTRQVNEMDKLDNLIESAIANMKEPFFKYGDYPAFYKCYICDEAWWHLYDFREHVKIHESAEQFTILNEVDSRYYRGVYNIICYSETRPDIRDIAVEGSCWQCCRAYSDHLPLPGSVASCTKCKELYRNCKSQMKHEHKCLRLTTPGEIQFDCKYCFKLSFSSAKLYEEHMQLHHSVRSDLMTQIWTKVCVICKEKYVQYNVHMCPLKALKVDCVFCHRRFPNMHQAITHTSITKPGLCPICKEDFVKSCMIVRHIAEKHSENFEIAYRCILCKHFLVCLTLSHLKFHMKTLHSIKYDKRRTGAACVILPKSCFQKTDGVVKEHTRICDPEESMNDSQDSIEGNTISKPSVLALTQALNDAEDKTAHTDDQTQCDIDIKNIKEEPEDYEYIDTLTYNKTQFERVFGVDNDVSTSSDVTYDDDVMNFSNNVEKGRRTRPRTREGHRRKTNAGENIPLITAMQCPQIKVKEEHSLNHSISTDGQNSPPISAYSLNADDPLHTEVIIKDEPEDYILFEDDDDPITLNPTDSSPSKRGRKPKVYKCNKCGYEGLHSQYRWHVSNDCRTFTCTMCQEDYNTVGTFLQHFHKHNIPPLSCPDCGEVFEDLSKLTLHVNFHLKYNYNKLNELENGVSSKKYQCRLCLKCVEMNNFFVHWETHLFERIQGRRTKATGLSAKGPVMSSSVLSPELVQALIDRLQYTESLKQLASKGCVVCFKKFLRHNDCKRHIIEHLLNHAYATRVGVNMLVCQICGDGFDKPDGYKYHMRVHGAMTLYSCKVCDKWFSDSSNFTKHKKLHNVKVFICDICSKKFVVKSSLEKHIIEHTQTDPKYCKECDKVFYSASAYRKHVLLRHSKHVQKFRCIICREKFDSLKHKWDHMWLIHNERKCNADCHLCDKSFRKRIDLKKHLRLDHNIHLRWSSIKDSTNNSKYSTDVTKQPTDAKKRTRNPTKTVRRQSKKETAVRPNLSKRVVGLKGRHKSTSVLKSCLKGSGDTRVTKLSNSVTVREDSNGVSNCEVSDSEVSNCVVKSEPVDDDESKSQICIDVNECGLSYSVLPIGDLHGLQMGDVETLVFFE